MQKRKIFFGILKCMIKIIEIKIKCMKILNKIKIEKYEKFCKKKNAMVLPGFELQTLPSNFEIPCLDQLSQCVHVFENRSEPLVYVCHSLTASSPRQASSSSF